MWTKLDDGFYANLKVLGLSDRAFRLYVTGLNWSVSQLTDGHIPEVALPLVLPTATPATRSKAIAELVAAGLWDPCSSHSAPCWLVHDFAEYQPTRDSVEADRTRNRNRQRKWRDKQRTDGVSNALVTEPDPSRPVPTLSLVEGGREKRELAATAILTEFASAQALEATPTWLKRYSAAAYEVLDRANGVDPSRLAAEFVPWAVSTGCRIPNGLPEFLGAWNATTTTATELPDCSECGNRRLVAMADEPDPTATYGFPILEVSDPDAAGWPIVQCPACMQPNRKATK